MDSSIRYFVVVAYDVRDNKRRGKIAKELLNFGVRVQYSVFECNLSGQQISALKRRLTYLIKADEDSVKIYVMDKNSKNRSHAIGYGQFTEDEDVYIF